MFVVEICFCVVIFTNMLKPNTSQLDIGGRCTIQDVLILKFFTKSAQNVPTDEGFFNMYVWISLLYVCLVWTHTHTHTHTHIYIYIYRIEIKENNIEIKVRDRNMNNFSI